MLLTVRCLKMPAFQFMAYFESLSPFSINFRSLSHKSQEEYYCSNTWGYSSWYARKDDQSNLTIVKARSFSSGHSQKGADSVSPGKNLPWLAAHKANEVRGLDRATSRTSWEKAAERSKKVTSRKEWEESTGKWVGAPIFGNSGTADYMADARERNTSTGEDENGDVVELADDLRWDRIKARYRNKGIVGFNRGNDNPEVRKWSKLEDWGKKTWKEATEASVPKMVGEGVYGVGPVLAALSVGRREFYSLYVQEGLDLKGNNRKKKDKKGFEKVLRIAEKNGLCKKELSKHDLNMIVDNRPHQGLVLDASPLEMVHIIELDPVLSGGLPAPLWVALDEVTDPQNLGAIIRSSYFFGASGVVLCAKNSSPLSGVVSKASAGSLELMEIRCCKNMMQFLASSAQNGWRVIGGSVSLRAIPLNEILPGEPTILVMGNEGTGLRTLVEKSCTHLVRIPGNISLDITARGNEDVESAEMGQGCSVKDLRSFLAVESLNVSVAAGVLLHHLIGTQ